MLLSSFQESCFLLMIFEKTIVKGVVITSFINLGFDLDPETLKDLTYLWFS